MPLDEEEIRTLNLHAKRDALREIKTVDLRRDSTDALEALPTVDAMEAAQKKAQLEMMRVLTASAKEMVEREIQIGLGQVVDEEGKAPGFMVQHLALKSLRQQVMGSPKQTIEQHSTSRSIAFKATYDIPAAVVDPKNQPERIAVPEAKIVARPSPKEIPAILATGPSAPEIIRTWTQQSVEASVSMPLDEYGAKLPKEEK